MSTIRVNKDFGTCIQVQRDTNSLQMLVINNHVKARSATSKTYSLDGDGNITNYIAFYVVTKYEKILLQHKKSELLVMFPSLSKVHVFTLEVATRAFISLLNHCNLNNFRASVYPYTSTKILDYRYCTCI